MLPRMTHRLCLHDPSSPSMIPPSNCPTTKPSLSMNGG